MSQRIGNMIIIAPEDDRKCELCDKVAECRPYGPKGEQICYECGMKNEAVTKRQMDRKLFGVQDHE